MSYYKNIHRYNNIINIFKDLLCRFPTEEEIEKHFYSECSLKQIFQIVCLTEEYGSKNEIDFLDTYYKWPYCQYFRVKYKNYLYIPIAKNACTSFKNIFFQLNKDILHEDYKNLHFAKGEIHRLTDIYRTNNLLGDYSPKENLEIQRKQPTHLIIVRHPAERIISSFWDKFCKSYDCEYTKRHITNDTISQISKKGFYIDENGITFKQFIEFLYITKDKINDAHFKQQTLYFDNGIKKKLFKFEESNNLTTFLNDKLSLKSPNVRLNSYSDDKEVVYEKIYNVPCGKLKNLKTRPSYASFIDDKIRFWINDIYKNDLALYKSIY